jgi:hypothetical protein
LRQADLQRVERRHVVDLTDAHHALPPLGPQDHEAAEDEGARHDHRSEQVRLDRLAEQEAEHDRRQEADADVDDEAPRALAAAELRDGVAQPLPVHQHHGEDRAGLDRDVEDLALVVGEAEQRAGENQVAGAGDRQELGETFDDAHEGGFDEQRDVQPVLSAYGDAG